MQSTPNRFPHLVFNAISQQTYEHLAYYRRVPDTILHPAQPEAEAKLFTLANTALKQARAANFPYIGTYIVASTFTPAPAPALNFGPNQPLPTAYGLHLLHQQSEYDIKNKATTLDELQQIAHTLDKDNYVLYNLIIVLPTVFALRRLSATTSVPAIIPSHLLLPPVKPSLHPLLLLSSPPLSPLLLPT